MTETEFLVIARGIFGGDCHATTVIERLRDLEDLDLVSCQVDADGVLPPTYSLTLKGLHKAAQLP